jgi:murein DD-endopeptidase MepM/ murein hydrolase activator NlpD
MANYKRIARKDARRYGLDPNIFARQIKAESGYNPNAISPAGARGIAQFMPGTARGLGVNPDNPTQALDAAAKLMADYVKKFGSYKNALVAYNAGPGRVGGKLPAETQNYIAKILGGSNPTQLSAPKRTTAATATNASYRAPSADARTQIALSLLGMGNLAGGYGGADPLTDALLSAAQAQNGANRGQVSPGAAKDGQSYGSAAPMSSGTYPLGKRGKVIGTPYAGTHAKAFNQAGGSDNWQSENAVDIRIPVGTPVYAEADGVLGNTGSLGQGGRFAGLRTNLIGKGQSWYYAHLSKLAPGIRAGAHVKKGQLLGYSGSANGVPHLHFAVQHGDPRRYVK